MTEVRRCLAGRAPGLLAHDYSYILATALEAGDRRAWKRELLDFYLERVAAAGGVWRGHARVEPMTLWKLFGVLPRLRS